MGRRNTNGRREAGFTLIELLIVMVIIAILTAIAIPQFRGSKTTVKRQEALVTAHSLQKAVEGFRRDREGRVPYLAADWPTAKLGPVDADALRPYMRAVTAENVRIIPLNQAGGALTAPYGATTLPLSVEYRPMAGGIPTTYRITVRDAGTVVCTLTNDPTAGSDTC